MITRRGIGFTVIATSVFFVASATRVGWLHVADAVLWGIVAANAMLPWITVPRLSVTQRVRSGGSEGSGVRRGEVWPSVGDSVDVEIEVSNPIPWPRFFVSVSLTSSAAASGLAAPVRYFFARIGRKNVVRSSKQVRCDQRGWQTFSAPTMESRMPFGLFRRRRTVEGTSRVLVYPRWFPMDRLGIISVETGDDSGRRRSRRGDEVTGSRPYVIGDSVRHMHWKNTARTGRPAVREYDAGAEEAVVVAIDSSVVSGEGTETTLEYAATLAATVSRSVYDRGGMVRLALPDRLSEPLTEWRYLMKELALMSPATDGSLAEVSRDVPIGSRMVAIVSSADSDALNALGSASRRGVEVGAVLLDGFEGEEIGLEQTQRLGRSGVNSVVCRPGELSEAIDAIQIGRPSNKRTVSRSSQLPVDENAKMKYAA